jgi:lipopolysaccharide transport system ATP-binding protein
MSDIAIRVDGLSKRYRIGASQNGRTLRETLTDTFTAPFRRARWLLQGANGHVAGTDNTIWALRDVCFTIGRGEIVGIIGRNGAGKSTLLKILSRITEPTTGFAEIRGRVGSLLEVGTGFHGELTGRENLYLNGAILGMKKVEIERKFDEIVAFAEVEKFIDTPVKHYSSGMYLRLAFAVAAHLEPEILIVDEVLAVGDASFQKKCLGKMEDVGKQGRTVIFVSHNMPAVTHLCGRAILLDRGAIVKDAPSHEVVSTYLNSGHSTMAEREWREPRQAPGGQVARLRAVRVRAEDGRIAEAIDIRRPVGIEMEYEVLQSGYTLLPYYNFHNEEGVFALEALDLDPAWRRRPRPAGRYTTTAWIPGNLLAHGILFVSVGLSTTDPAIDQFHERDAVAFHIIDSFHGDSARGDWTGPLGGAVIRPALQWSTQFNPNEDREAANNASSGS